MSTPHEIFTAGRLLARMKTPYFRAMLLGLVPREVPGLGTVGVTPNGILIWDPEFVGRVTAEQMAGLFVHEVMHLCLKHTVRALKSGHDLRLDNMAGDLAINPGIIDMGLQLPQGRDAGLFPEQFGFARGLTKDEYYHLLRKLQEAQPSQGGGKGGQAGEQGQGGGQGGQQGDGDEGENEGQGDGQGGGQDDDHANPGGGGGEGQGSSQAGGQAQGGGDPKDPRSHGHTPKAGGGWCGGCAGRPMPGEPTEGDPHARSDAELQRLARQVAEAIREAASRSRGTVPGGWARWADEALEPPRIPWQTKLARLTRCAVAYRTGAVDHRYDAPSRRQAGVGYGRGKPILPRLRHPVPNVTVIIDTSGSMGSAELGDAAREVSGVLKAVGAQVTLTVCDSDVHGLRKVRHIQDALGMLRGGGGTDMRPAFEAAMKERPRPEVIVCITDGLVGNCVPDRAPQGVQVLWVGVGPHRMRPAPWGEYVEVERDAA